VVDNNLGLAAARYNLSMAETDILRARSGQAPRGTNGVPIPAGLFAGAIGAGLNDSGFGGGGGQRGGGEGGISGNARIVQISPRGAYDPRLNINFSIDTETSPLNSTRVSGVATPTSHTTAVQMFYSQAFTTGTSFSLGWNIQRGSTTELNQRFNPSFAGRLNFSVNQRLWNGFGYSVTRRFERVAENNTQLTREAFRQQAVATLAEAQNLYWDLVASREEVRAAEQALAVAQRLREDNARQAEIGTLAPLDVVAAEAEVAGRERDLVVAETNLQLQETRLKDFLSKKPDPELDIARITLTDRMPEPRDADIPDVTDALTNAYNNRPDLRQFETSVQNQNLSIRFTQNSLKPSGAIFGLYAGSGLDGNAAAIRGGAGGSLNQAFTADFPEYAGGFSLSLPFRNRAAQADNLRAQLEGNQLEVELQNNRNQVSLEVRQAIIGLIQGKAQVEAAHQAVLLARQTLDAEERKLQAGVSTPYQAVLRQRDVIGAENAEVQAVASYAKALVEMDRAMGTTLSRNGIEIEDAFSGTITRMPTPPFSVRGFTPQEGSE
jgi:outer membrane protein TolC